MQTPFALVQGHTDDWVRMVCAEYNVNNVEGICQCACQNPTLKQVFFVAILFHFWSSLCVSNYRGCNLTELACCVYWKSIVMVVKGTTLVVETHFAIVISFVCICLCKK